MEWYVCMYTKHKTRKSKVWHDGFAEVNRPVRRVVLYRAHEEGRGAEERPFETATGVACIASSTSGSLTDLEFETDAHLIQLCEPCAPPVRTSTTDEADAARSATAAAPARVLSDTPSTSLNAAASVAPLRRRVGMLKHPRPAVATDTHVRTHAVPVGKAQAPVAAAAAATVVGSVAAAAAIPIVVPPPQPPPPRPALTRVSDVACEGDEMALLFGDTMAVIAQPAAVCTVQASLSPQDELRFDSEPEDAGVIEAASATDAGAVELADMLLVQPDKVLPRQEPARSLSHMERVVLSHKVAPRAGVSLLQVIPPAACLPRPATNGMACSECRPGIHGPRAIRSRVLCDRCFWKPWLQYAVNSSTDDLPRAQAFKVSSQCMAGAILAFQALWQSLSPSASSAVSVRQAARTAGAALYVLADLVKMRSPAEAAAAAERRKLMGNKRRRDDDDEEEVDPSELDAHATHTPMHKASSRNTLGRVVLEQQAAAAHDRKRLFLRFHPDEREKSSVYSKDDWWVIASSLRFGMDVSEYGLSAPPELPVPPANAKDYFAPSRATHEFVVMARAAFHAPSSQSMLELVPISAVGAAAGSAWSASACWPATGSSRSVRVAALRLPNMSIEAAAIETLHTLSTCPAPAMPPLAPFVFCRDRVATREASVISDVVAAPAGLNEDQASVFQASIRALQQSRTAAAGAAVICHGCFGSGKSRMICEIVQAIRSHAPSTRVLIASATNVAVDRLLTELLDRGVDDIARVGSVTKMARRLLPFALPHSDTSEAIRSAVADLRTMLSEHNSARGGRAPSEHDVDVLRDVYAAIAALETRKDHVQRLQQAAIVGATCAAIAFPILQHQWFDVVVLDECSQLTDAQVTTPLLRYGARVLLAVGDPRQLPPVTVDMPEALRVADGAATWFDRLTAAFPSSVHPLRIQYRCHPLLGDVASRLFYGAALRSGVSPSQRAPVLPDLSPLVVFDSSRVRVDEIADLATGADIAYSASPSETRTADGSFYNNAEADAIAAMVAFLLESGIPATDIGVICMYRAQLAAVTAAFSRRYPDAVGTVQVATVDAFQGSEREVIMLSTVRSQRSTVRGDALGGFLDDPQRVNVAITRARRHLLVFGHIRTLVHSRIWRSLIVQAAALPGGIRALC